MRAGAVASARRFPVVRWSLVLALAPPAAYVISTVPGVRARPGYDLALDGVLAGLAYAAAPAMSLLQLRSAQGRRAAGQQAAGAVLALALALYALGNVLWAIPDHPGAAGAKPPSGTDLVNVALYPLAFVVLMLWRERRAPLSEWLDGLVGGLAVAALASALVVRPMPGPPDATTPMTLAAATSHPMVDLILLLIVVTAMSLFSFPPPVGACLLALGLLLAATADLAHIAALPHHAPGPGGLLDGLRVCATTLIGLSPGWRTRPVGIRPSGRVPMLVPSVSAAAALGLLVENHTHLLALVTVTLAAATLLLALVRLIVTVREADALAGSRDRALIDELTGLGSRRALFDLAPARIAQLPQHREVALLVLDLDRFKEINDSLGHQAGDMTLRVVASRLARSVDPRRADLVRLGGDEFAFLLLDAGEEAARACAQSVHEALAAPVRLDGVTVWVGASIGISCRTAGDAELPVMMREADVAMYQAKADHDTPVLVYSPDRDSFADSDRLETIQLLRHAVGARQMVLHYQPKIGSRSQQVHGLEALVRWNHPTRGLLPPDAFLGLLEDIGLMRELTDCVLELVLDQLVRWQSAGRRLSVAVNLPASALVDLGLPERVAGMLEARNLPPEYLEIEITEDFLMRDRDRARDILGRLRSLGIRIAVDDYGTGYSSLAYLKELPVDVLKLDKSFLRDIHVDPRAMAIVDSTIALAHSLGLTLVAEGVEDDATSARLAASGCDFEQGWRHSKALPPAELETWLDGQTRRPTPPVPRSPVDTIPDSIRS